MNREIKFKSYIRNKDTGEIKSVIWIPFPIDHYEGDGGEILKSYEEIIDYGLQFTGLKDKNGKEIYEGDIVSHNSMPDSTINPALVKFEYGMFCFFNEEMGHTELIESLNYCEVSGNIYENPDLL